MNKKAVELTLRTVIIAILAIIVLVVLILIFYGYGGRIANAFTEIIKEITGQAEQIKIPK